LAVRVLRGAGPLLCLALPVAGSIGGKSRRRGVGPHLQRPLVGVAAQVVELVEHLPLAGVDPRAVRRVVDRLGNTPQGLLHPLTHLLEVRLR
jgi:hypothetical protein